ncbi:MAG: hypothetical protein VYC42_01650 [Pseudomonadota bacterium]|nr:hypothetical protein [Pseudomonadota bacterium]
MRYNPYAQSNPIEAGIRSAAGIIGIQDAVQARADRAADRASAAEEGGIRRALGKAQIEQAQLGVEKQRREADAAQRRTDLIGRWQRARNRVDVLSSPEAFDTLADFAAGMQEGNGDAVAAAWPRALHVINRLNAGDVDEGIGQQLPSGETILGKELADLRRTKDGGLVTVLNITAKDKDGNIRTFDAPVTVDRSANPKAQIKTMTEDDALGFFMGALETGLAIQRGEITRQHIDDEFRAGMLELGVKPSEIDEYIAGGKAEGKPFEAMYDGQPRLVQRYSDGSLRPVQGAAPYVKPEGSRVVGGALVDAQGRVLYRDAGKPSATWGDYQRAKAAGEFQGTFIDFKRAVGGQGLSVTLPDGTVVQQGGAPVKMTEQQSKDLVYFTRGQSALQSLDPIADELAIPTQAAAGAVPLVGNAMVSSRYQQAEQAGREFLASILRKDTGAAVTRQEFELYGKTFLPQPFDSREVLAQKQRARAVALDAIRKGLGPAEILTRTQASGAPRKIANDADYDALPSGTVFVGPDGKTRRKP